MGTRADFYIGRGEKAEWIGSIAYDGYPEGIQPELIAAKDADIFRKEVSRFLQDRADKTLPTDGWPWPWHTSKTTDYAYAFDKGRVFVSRFGSPWYNAVTRNGPDSRRRDAVFPNMAKAKQRVKFGPHSGVMLITSGD